MNAQSPLNQDLINELLEFIHFIRTPLASIKIGAHILHETLPLVIPSIKEDGANAVMNKIDKLHSIINNIVTEANRISEHTQKIEMQITKQTINSEEGNG